jgi:hypothetical protein
VFDENSLCVQCDSSTGHLNRVGQTDESQSGRQNSHHPSPKQIANEPDRTGTAKRNIFETGAGEREYHENERRGPGTGYPLNTLGSNTEVQGRGRRNYNGRQGQEGGGRATRVN